MVLILVPNIDKNNFCRFLSKDSLQMMQSALNNICYNCSHSFYNLKTFFANIYAKSPPLQISIKIVFIDIWSRDEKRDFPTLNWQWEKIKNWFYT